MIDENINTVQNLSNSIKISLNKRNKSTVLDELSTLVAVGVWADKKVKEEELIMGESIINTILSDSDDIKFTEKLVTKKLKAFRKNKKFFEHKKQELIEIIVNNENHAFSKYIFNIFKSDGEIVSEEQEIIDELAHSLKKTLQVTK